jgi:hypothetical protein
MSSLQSPHREGYDEGCGENMSSDGKYARITYGDESARLGRDKIESVNGYDGCDKFEPSGLPAHPSVLEVLVQRNPLCSAIPSDPNAKETSWDFSGKIDVYLPKESTHVPRGKIQ